MKENDYFLNTLANPSFFALDFLNVGLDPTNTSLEKPETYLGIDSIKANPIFQNSLGQFDLAKFDKVYNKASNLFNLLANLKSSTDIGSTKIFHRNDIFAPKSMRKDNTPEFTVSFVGNPHRQLESFITFGLKEAPTKSDREIAQTQQVWDPATKLWHDAPNDSFFGDFFDTRVLAQYDEDIKDENGNIIHTKGEKKIDPNTGTYYYENLNGRDIYGREVLSKFDTLTTDGSFANKFDFFDSDDLDKSFGGNLMKNAIKVIPAFIPGVSPWYIGARVGLEFMNLMPKIGKIVSGSDSPIFSLIEGFSKSFDLSSSDYALLTPWSMENMLNMTADVFTLLAEQRWLFLYGPALFNGGKVWNKKTMETFLNDILKNLNKESTEKLLSKGITEETLTKLKGLEAVNTIRTQHALEELLNSYNKLGEYLSKAYMTGVTVADSYGEAKESGLSDLEASLFTLGYAAGEYGILSTGLGEWILPELRMERAARKLMIRQIIKSPELEELTSKQLNKTASKEEKKSWMQKWFKAGNDSSKGVTSKIKKFFNGELDEEAAVKALQESKSIFKLGGEHLLANALGEGTEEVTEELLADFSKTIFNGASWLLGNDSYLNAWDKDSEGNILWSNLASRYGLSFIGGLVGGGLALGLPAYKEAFKIKSLDLKSAYEELVHLVKEGKGQELKDLASKMTLGNEYLGVETQENGNFKFNTERSLDYYAKTNFNKLIDSVDTILKSNDAKISDESLISHLSMEDLNKILKDLKLLNISKSDVLGYYVLDFNSILANIVKLTLDIETLEKTNGGTDSKPEKLSDAQLLELNKKKTQLKQMIDKKNLYLDGTMSKEFILDALFESSDSVNTGYDSMFNFVNYVLHIENKHPKNITKHRMDELKLLWENIKSSGILREKIHHTRKIFDFINKKFSDKIKNHDAEYFQNAPNTFITSLLDSLIANKSNTGVLETLANSNNIVDLATKHLDINGTNKLNEDFSKRIYTLSTLVEALGNDLETVNIFRLLVEYPINLSEFKTYEDLARKFEIARTILQKTRKIAGLNLTELSLNELKNNHKELSILDTIEEFNALSDLYKQILVGTYIVDNYDNITDKELKNYHDKELALGIKSFLNNNTEAIIELLKKSKYINPNIKMYLKDFFKEHLMFGEINDENEEIPGALDSYLDLNDKVDNLNKVLDEINNSPVQDLLDQFLLSLSDKTVPLSKLLEHLHQQILTGVIVNDISSFGIDEEVAELLEKGLLLTRMLKSHIAAARVDNIDIDNVFGYNKVSNLLNPDLDLAQIDKNIGNSIIYDLNKFEAELKFYKALYEANAGQRLNEENKTSLALARGKFKKVLKFIISIIPDDWEGKQEIVEVFSDLNNPLLSGKDLIELEKLGNLYKEIINTETAVHNFLNKNIAKLKDPELFQKVFNPDNFNLIDLNENLINKSIQNKEAENVLNDVLFMHYLATLTAINPTSFYNELKSAINPNFAPISALILAVQSAYAYELNGQVFDIFNNIYNTVVDNYVVNASKEELDDLYKRYGYNLSREGKYNSDFHVLFNRHFLIEGIAGSGKSSACITLLRLLLQNNHKEEMKEKVWIVHKSKDQALKMATDAGFKKEDIIILTKDEYLKKINSKYVPLLNEEGKENFTYDQLKEDENGIPGYNLAIEAIPEKPSLILIDEATNLSLPDFKLSEDFLKTIDRRAIITGDFNLTSETHIDSKSDAFMGTVRNNFAHSPKLGLSLRTDNLIKDQNIAGFISQLENLFKTLSSEITKAVEIPLGYVLKEEGFYGDNYSKSLDLAKNIITTMFKTLKEKEVIHIISDNPNSELVLFAKSLGNVDILTSKTAQGLEGLYYIIDLDGIADSTFNLENNSVVNADARKTILNLYTFLSRSKLGTILVGNQGPNINFINSELKEVLKFALSAELKKEAGEKLIKAITEALGTSEIAPTVWSKETPVKKETYVSESGETADNEAEDENEENTAKRNAHEITLNPPAKKADGTLSCEMLLHTFICNETGLEKQGEDYYLTDNNTNRIDNFNGLRHLKNPINNNPLYEIDSDGKLKNPEKALNHIARIRNAIIYSKNPSDLRNILKTELYLSNDDEVKVELYFKASEADREDDKKPDYKKWGIFSSFFKHITEWIYGVPDGLRQDPRNKNIVAVVKNKNGKVIYETSLFSFTNPLTLMTTPGYEKVNETYDLFILSDPENSTKFDKFADYLDSNNIENSLQISKLFRIYAINGVYGTDSEGKNRKQAQVMIPLKYNGNDFLPSELFELLGISTTSNAKGMDYRYDSTYEYDGHSIPLSELKCPGRYISKKVYSLDPEDKNNKYEDFETGHPFVLVSDFRGILRDDFGNIVYDDGIVDSDDKIFKLFRYLLLHPNAPKIVKAVYVTPPGVSIKEFFNNFNLLWKKQKSKNVTVDDTYDYTEGNDLTVYRILHAITNEESEFSKNLKNTIDLKEGSTLVEGPIEKWAAIKEIITYLDHLSPEERLEALNSSVEGKSFEYTDKNGNKKTVSLQYTVLGKSINLRYSGAKLKNILNGAIKSFILMPYWNTPTKAKDAEELAKLDAIINERIAQVERDLLNPKLNKGFKNKEGNWENKDIVIKQIFYKIPFEETSKSSKFSDLTNTKGLKATAISHQTVDYQFKGKPILINGKLDSTMFKGDPSFIMDLIIKTIENIDNVRKLATDYMSAVMKKDEDPPERKSDSIYDNFEGNIPETLKHLNLKDTASDMVKLIKEACNQGYFIISLENGKYRFSNKPLENGVITSMDGGNLKIVSKDTIFELNTGDKYKFNFATKTVEKIVELPESTIDYIDLSNKIFNDESILSYTITTLDENGEPIVDLLETLQKFSKSLIDSSIFKRRILDKVSDLELNTLLNTLEDDLIELLLSYLNKIKDGVNIEETNNIETNNIICEGL